MRRNRKLIFITVLVTLVVLVGSLGGIALARAANTTDIGGVVLSQAVTENVTQPKGIFERVAAILAGQGVNVTPEQLKAAHAQAQKDMQLEALKNRLQKMVEAGKLTQAQADQYFSWWQAKPDVPFGPGLKPLPRPRMHRGFAPPPPPLTTQPSTAQ